ncbi:MAG TPA: response regulator transcription factor [Anaerolineales bacterium]|nr:response regulator transcription factor [Anaerolineales bacterium]
MSLPRVLIVDDVEQVRSDLRTALSLSGDLEIIGEASNGLEAVHLSESLKPDVALMDLEMPVMDGYEATRQIKSRCPSCRIVALTVHDYEAARLRAHESGVDAFLVKGASVKTIIQTIVENVPQVRSNPTNVG